ncbi:DUF431-domain-containing protein [Thelephora ganbajun]|uniref:DUF431-domain-containing protein n=1 Tax=Thelephora ganbajun TaxID=370292 RepID=A0ACB6Z491_THEGA|nr:DUF431-domain-containing protein [Thelephora ganbajun]
MPFRYFIEHMEEDDATPKALPDWVELEYKHMRMLAGSGSEVHFTHLSQACGNSLLRSFGQAPTETRIADVFCTTKGVLDLIKAIGIPLDQVCLLDPKAEHELSPNDTYTNFLFGVGDDPPRDRTSELRVLGFPTRHLGPIQMTTDTALGVTKLVVRDKVPLSVIPYKDCPTIVFNHKESVEMPFRYIADGDEPRLPPGMRELLREDLNKSFDF